MAARIMINMMTKYCQISGKKNTNRLFPIHEVKVEDIFSYFYLP